MHSNEVRRRFLEFFEAKGHTIVPSSSLVPHNDPTLLFTNAGMVPFKELFLGFEARDYTRATSSQRCVRAGGKHNDLENVGYTARHHTFFEMLGNFSFGDYAKRDAISWAWELLTNVYGLSAEKLWVTVYDKDDETASIWLDEMKIDPTRFSRCGEKDNFWTMGDTGPCGPCTEIFYDHGADIPGGPPGTPEEDGDRYIEIWNIVFTQYERSADGTLTKIPKPSVDTGMGLERISAVLQDVHNNYDTDLFQGVIKKMASIAGIDDLQNTSLRVIADHIRSAAFLIIDGVNPTNEGRGYVLRRIIRRALRHGHALGVEGLFFHTLVEILAATMQEMSAALFERQAQVAAVLKKEELQFAKTLSKGMHILSHALTEITDKQLPGEVAFRLYDTYGFPFDLTADIVREHDMTVDEAGFQAAMEKQREQSRGASQFKVDYIGRDQLPEDTVFKGYDTVSQAGDVKTIIQAGKTVTTLENTDPAVVALDETPFYAESGGQVGDQGELTWPGGCFVVRDTQKQGAVFLHYGHLKEGTLKTGETVDANVNPSTREATVYNHSATHLMHAALQKSLGDHVTQKGSLVKATGLRFDFSHDQAVTADEIETIEALVNAQVQKNLTIKTEVLPIEDAKKRGAMALFGEKYGDKVRVLSMGDFSVELCGGTHAQNTGDIHDFVITAESAISAGTRRIEAMTHEAATAWRVQQAEKLLAQLTHAHQQVHLARQTLMHLVDELGEKLTLPEAPALTDMALPDAAQFRPWMKAKKILLADWQAQLRDVNKQLDRFKAKQASHLGNDLLSQAKEIGDLKVLAVKLLEVDSKSLRSTVDQLKQKLGTAVVVLGTVNNGKAQLIAGVTDDATDRVKAGELVNVLAQQVGGRGGGRADMAQAGGPDVAALDTALASVYDWVSDKVT